ncbi:hypothetical protein [Cryptosporangium sp. NPDC048952]|uniref:hypothetical protein n=1 Tax=Cryptosporangium sp. NPDC048952 TaxID=3363961 RepID=UPI00372227F0
MYKLRRLHLDTVGVPENRFADLTLETVSADGSPADSLIWMRNGSGKTTIMSLLIAHILPGRRDFLAARKRRRKGDVTRTLEDLVLGDDTAHVVAEWEAPDGAILLTGAVWEWTNKRRPVDHNGVGAQKLKRLFWTMRPDPELEGTDLADLPLTHRTRGTVDLERFGAYIRARAAAGADAVVVDQIEAWRRVLEQRGFDAELYRYFVTINATDGGIDTLFTDIRSENDFARYLLGFVADSGRAAAVRDLLSEVATELAQRPGYQTQQRFCVDAQPLLAAVADAHNRVTAAERARDTAGDRAAGFRRGLLAAAHDAERGARLAGERYTTLDGQRRDLHRRTEGARRRRDELLRLAALHRERDAKDELAAAEQERATARLVVRSWDAVPALLQLRRARAAVDTHRGARRRPEAVRHRLCAHWVRRPGRPHRQGPLHPRGDLVWGI